MNKQHTFLSRTGFALLVVFSGLLMLPLTGLSAAELNWQTFAHSYDADLDIVSEEDKAYPGSAFHFVATGYPPNTVATVEIDGRTRGAVMTDSNGRADFLIQTDSSDPFGRFDVIVYTDANYYDDEDFRLEDDEPFQPAPPGWDGYVFTLFGEAAEMTVNHASGAPGSAFVFTATGFPANKVGAVSIDGEVRSLISTNGAGVATFAVQSNGERDMSGDGNGTYYVSIKIDGTIYALSTCTLADDDPVWDLPGNFNGPVIPLNNTVPTAVELTASSTTSTSSGLAEVPTVALIAILPLLLLLTTATIVVRRR